MSWDWEPDLYFFVACKALFRHLWEVAEDDMAAGLDPGRKGDCDREKTAHSQILRPKVYGSMILMHTQMLETEKWIMPSYPTWELSRCIWLLLVTGCWERCAVI